MTNRGLMTTDQKGHLKNYGNLWYHKNAISNNISLINVRKKNRIIYNSNNLDIFIVIITIPGGHDMIFAANNDGLYHNNISNTKVVYILSAMEENIKTYTQ